MVANLRSPIPWIGGKHYSAERIIKAFPHHGSYKTYVEVFGGAAHVLLRKLPYKHLEVYNDYNRDLVNFWMQCRNHPQELQQNIDSLPYARSLYEDWQESLFDDTLMNDMERAVRWFYVLRSATGAEFRKAGGNWGHQVVRTGFGDDAAHKMHSAAQVFGIVAQRFHRVQIECKDFESILRLYERPTTFFYCDPPYIGAEFYYRGVPSFTMADHERLAQILNATSAQIALSYYPHEKLEEWYPAPRWHRMSWQTHKHSEKTTEKRQVATEMLLTNYEPATRELWEVEAAV